jgi:hypothetical protein
LRGTRNHQLNESAFNLGQLVPHALDRHQVEAALLDVAISIGLTEHEATATIRSGLDAGTSQPRAIPEQPIRRDRRAAERAPTVREAEHPPEVPDDLFRRWSAAELLAAPRDFRWTVKGVLVEPTYGMVGGEKKSLKSYVSTFLDIAIATGVPLFDTFTVDRAGAVNVYVGEGGRIPYTRRLERIARSMHVDLDDAPLHASFDVAPLASDIFRDTLRRDLEQLEPVLVHIDPYYAFHGAATNSSNLHEEGTLLAGLHVPCINAGASLLINNHFNKSGAGTDLDRITQSGGGEWVDSWILLSHRERPDVEHGRFQLLLEIGSRQWGGTSWDLDLDVGRFDIEAGEYDGAITWDIGHHQANAIDSEHEARIVELVSHQPAQHTREELAKSAGGRVAGMRAVVDRLEAKGHIRQTLIERFDTLGRPRKTWVFVPADAGTPDAERPDRDAEGRRSTETEA